VARGFGVDHDFARRQHHRVGDLGSRAPPSGRPLELQQLAAAFHQRDVPGPPSARRARRPITSDALSSSKEFLHVLVAAVNVHHHAAFSASFLRRASSPAAPSPSGRPPSSSDSGGQLLQGARDPGAGQAGADHGSSTSVVTGPVEGDWRHPADCAAKTDLAFVLGEFQFLGVFRRQYQRHHRRLRRARVHRLSGRDQSAGGEHPHVLQDGGGGSFGHGAGPGEQHITRAPA